MNDENTGSQTERPISTNLEARQNQINQVIASVLNLHKNMGEDLAELGGVLRCKICGHEQSLNAEQIADYLAHGWPEHCEQSMLWVTQRLLDEERTNKTTPDNMSAAETAEKNAVFRVSLDDRDAYIIADSIKDLQHVLEEYVFGDNEEWRKMVGCQCHIKIEEMYKKDFETQAKLDETG